MAKISKQQQIEALRAEVQEWKDCVAKLEVRIQEMQKHADKDFENSQLYSQSLYKIDFLEKFLTMGQKNLDMMQVMHQKDMTMIQKLSIENKKLAEKLQGLCKGVDSGEEIEYNLTEKEWRDKFLAVYSQNTNKDELIGNLYKTIEEQWGKIAELEKGKGKKSGRKELPDDIKEQIHLLRDTLAPDGKKMPIRRIAKEVGCSVGVVHKYLLSENKHDE